MKEMLGGLRRAQGGSEVDALVRAPCLSDAYNYPSAAELDPDDGGFFAGAEEEDEVTDDLLAALEEQARIAVANELRVRVPSPPPMGRMDLRPSTYPWHWHGARTSWCNVPAVLLDVREIYPGRPECC